MKRLRTSAQDRARKSSLKSLGRAQSQVYGVILYFVVNEYFLTLFPEPQSHIIQALKNQDILSLIFQHFDLQPGSETVAQTRKDLFSAAKTCKAFVEPALDSLWRVLPSLLPLLMLLPSAEVKNGCYVSSVSSY